MQTQTLRLGILSQLREQIGASNTDEEVQGPATNVMHATITKIMHVLASYHQLPRFLGGWGPKLTCDHGISLMISGPASLRGLFPKTAEKWACYSWSLSEPSVDRVAWSLDWPHKPPAYLSPLQLPAVMHPLLRLTCPLDRGCLSDTGLHRTAHWPHASEDRTTAIDVTRIHTRGQRVGNESADLPRQKQGRGSCALPSVCQKTADMLNKASVPQREHAMSEPKMSPTIPSAVVRQWQCGDRMEV